MRIGFIIGFLLPVLNLSAQRFDFTQFSTPEGLPQPGIYDIISDSTGFLWVATENGGLLKFNGSKFELIGAEDGLAEESVRVLYFDSENQLWFGTEKMGLGRVNQDGIRFFGADDGLPVLHYRAIVSDSNANVYAASLDGKIFRSGMESWSEMDLPDSLNVNSIRAALCDVDNVIWFATDNGVLRLKQDQFTLYNSANGLSDPDVLSLFYDETSGIWAGTQTGAFRFQDSAWIQISHPKLIGKRIRSIAADALGGVWFGSNNGLIRLEFEADSIVDFELFTENNGLSNNRIRKVYKDHSNTMWFGTFFGGISRLCDMSVSRFDARSGWPDNIVTAIEESDEKTVYLGTFEGNVYRYQNHVAQRIFSDENGQDNRINDLLFVDAKLWIATSGKGVWTLSENGQLSNIAETAPADGLISFGSSGLWAWSGSDLINLTSKQRLSFVDYPDGWTSATIWNDQLVIAGPDGLLILDSLMSPMAVPAELQSESFSDVNVDPSGNLWLATQLRGLLRFDGTNTESFKSKSNLPDPRIKAIKFDDDYNLWVATAKGLVRWEMDPEFQIVLDQEFIDSHDGLRNAVCIENAMYLSLDNTLWLGTLGGLFRLSPGKHFLDVSAPELILQGIDLRYEQVGWDTLGFAINTYGIPVFPAFQHDQNHLTFRWAAIETGNDYQVMYEYRLLGLDSTWSWPRTEPYVTFTSLPPGEYELQIRAKSRSNYWSLKPLSYRFIVSSPWYKKPWVIVIGIFFLGTLVWLVFRFRLVMLKRENLRLEQKVQERTFELEAEKKKSDELLLNILPEETAEELKREGQARSRKYKEVSVLFSDFKGFTQLTEQMPSRELVASLDECFRAFDRHTSEFKVEKIKTIGDAYMCATGLPQEDPHHARHMVQFALAMIAEMERINAEREKKGDLVWPIRIGIHSGPVVAGVVGEKKFAFDIWGDTVNIASRMESSGKSGKINISSATYELIKDEFDCKPRGKVEAKNKGELEMYFIRITK
jgi:class 3 adenylate cyclase/ligand-binding sensor domain-containing protein